MKADPLASVLLYVASLTLASDASGATLADPSDVDDACAEALHFGHTVCWFCIERPDWPMQEPRPALAWLGLVAVGDA